MTRRSTLITALVCVLLTPGASSTAQTIGATTGSVNGRVTDRTGAFLMHVAVVVSGKAVMGQRTAVTDARGAFEVPALPPGEFTLMFSLSGYRTLSRDGVQVSLGATTTIDAVLDLATTGEPVVVSGKSPVIDRSGTAITVGLDAELLANVPGSRSMSTILAATPSVQLTRFDVGGNAAVEPGPWSAYGTSGNARPSIEGVSITGHNPLGFTLDYGSFEHVAVGLGAYGPESPWPGVQIQFITKSGSNRHHGSVYLDYEHRRWQSFNIDEDQVRRRVPAGIGLPAREVNRLWGYHDANADAGGPLRKDRLWWYLSLRAQETSAKQVSFPVKPLRTDTVNVGGKATAQARGNNRFIVFGQATWNRQPYRLGGLLRPTASVNRDEDSTTRQAAQGGVWKAEWNSVAGQRLFFELLGGQFIAGRHERPTFFDLFVLVANAGDADAEVEATYLLPDGATVKKSYTIAAGRRSTIHVDLEDAKLSDTAVSTTVRSVNDVPIVVERAMWWPDGGWSEGHSSAGVTTTGTAWAIADGEVGGARDVDTYILVANTSETTGAVKVTLLFEDGTSVDKLFTVSGRSRFNVDVRDQFPAAVNRRFGALVESQGSAPVHLVVERSMYWNASGQFWAAGTNALATRLQ